MKSTFQLQSQQIITVAIVCVGQGRFTPIEYLTLFFRKACFITLEWLIAISRSGGLVRESSYTEAFQACFPPPEKAHCLFH